jgi:predicted GH43/DUF377 family glycosyl hydrolase
VLAFAAGCGRYGDFTLPVLPGGALEYSWEAQPAPVLGPVPGGWDSGDVLNPVVVRRNGLYYNFYSGYDGRTWHTGLATSRDGVAWTRHGKALSPGPAAWEGGYIAANGAALHTGGEFLYWYQAGPKDTPSLGLARSPDGQAWARHPEPVLRPGPRGSWDERGVGDPDVIRIGPWFYMFYLGQDRARRQRLGLARSRDGVRWQKLRSSPVLELGAPGAFDEVGLGEPAVWSASGSYYMLYTGRDRAENRRLGLARSTDGVRWHRLPLVAAGAEPWNAKVLCDPSVEPAGDTVRVWFGGGDVASPDENLHGRIGLGLLRPAGGR